MHQQLPLGLAPAPALTIDRCESKITNMTVQTTLSTASGAVTRPHGLMVGALVVKVDEELIGS